MKSSFEDISRLTSRQTLREPTLVVAAKATRMRRGVLLFLVLNVTIIGFLIHTVWTLLTLLVVDGSKDAIARAELPTVGSSNATDRPLLIPKIIHQTYKDNRIPPIWQDAQQSCIDLHRPEDGWEYRFWTDEDMSKFIRQEYAWFAETFEGYKYPIQRADSIRYFVLAHFGGIYIDLDDGCKRDLEPLLSYPAWVRKTMPTGISNDAMGAAPQHPFFLRVLKELQRYDRNWLLPYITVMASTGPLFLSIIWRLWSSEGLNVGDGPKGGRVRILFPKEYQKHQWSFFTHHRGNSWHGADVEFIFWMARNWIFLTVFGFVVGFIVIFCIWWTYHRFVLERSAFDGPRWKTTSTQSRFLLWRRLSMKCTIVPCVAITFIFVATALVACFQHGAT